MDFPCADPSLPHPPLEFLGTHVKIPYIRGERPLKQVMAKLIRSLLRFVDTGCFSLKARFKNSALDMGKIRVFIVQK